MTRAGIVDGIEMIVVEPARLEHPVPLLFVHGAFAGAWVWAERLLPYFAARGFRAAAVSLRGHGGSRDREHIDALGIADFVDDVAVAIGELGRPPIVIGHSMGGFVAQKLLERHTLPGVVLVSSVPPQGLMGSTVHLAIARPGLLLNLNRLMGGGSISAQTMREALFAHDVPVQRLREYSGRMSMESQRAIWDMTIFNLVAVQSICCPPMLVLGMAEDRLIPPFLVESTARAYGVQPTVFDGFGHAFMLEPGCESIADAIIGWLCTLQH